MMRRCDACAYWQENPDGWQNGVATLLTAPDFGCVEFAERTGAPHAA